MYLIEIQNESGKTLLNYESEVAPMKDDIYSGNTFNDGIQRTIYERQMLTSEYCQRNIIVRCKITYPDLHK